MSVKLGITGGIGSGKSVISHLLKIMGIPVYDSDSESKRLLETDVQLQQELTAIVGKELYADGSLNKKLLASYIFGQPEHLKAINAIIHPAVKRDFMRWAAQRASLPIVGLESAILIDAGFASTVDEIVNVTAPLSVRIQRIAERDHTSLELIRKRIKSQMSDRERNKASHYRIVNNNRKPLIKQVLSLIASLSKKHSLSLLPTKNISFS